MPIYTYVCNTCKLEFELFILNNSQAFCKCAIPNSNRAYCPECKTIIAYRTFKDIHLSRMITKETIVALCDYGKPKPDPCFDGKPTINAGRNYGVVVDLNEDNKDQKEYEVSYVLLRDEIGKDCSCKFCSKVVLTDEQITAKERHIENDRELGRLLSAGSLLDTDGNSPLNPRHATIVKYRDNLQKQQEYFESEADQIWNEDD